MILIEIAERIEAMSFDGAPRLAQEAAREAVLDTVGVTLAGASSEAAICVAAAFSTSICEGKSTVFGGGRQVDPLGAAMLNGVASHAHDFDDCSNSLGGHPSAPVIPAIWALAEANGQSGRDFLSAYIAGVECETRIARAVNFHHYEKGWHPTATLGTFGAAAASARLLQLSPEQIAVALALAASMASGIKANFGTMAKPFHVGQTARNGLSAALLAKAGMTANPGALEHRQGFFAVYDEGEVDEGACLRNWGDPLDLIEPGIAFKRHPCCASTHPAIDALLMLRESHGLEWKDVAHIKSWTHPRRLRHTNRPEPKSGLDAKFSVQYVLARALENGRLALDDFTDARAADPSVRRRMALITAEPHPEADMESTEHFFAEVIVTLKHGDRLTQRVERPLGRDRSHPLPKGALKTKFLDCARMAIDEASALSLANELGCLESIADISSLAALISGPPQYATRKIETA